VTHLRKLFLAGLLLLISISIATAQPPNPAPASASESIACANPNHHVYVQSPTVFAPDGTRALGLTVRVGGQMSPPPDLRPACLPIAVRYNNYGVLKTPRAGPWPGQLAKDGHGHAVFETVDAGVAAWVMWLQRRAASGHQTSMSIMSLYAPPDDCVGSIGIPPNCPYGINPTREYATRVASAVNLGPDDSLSLDTRCQASRDGLYAIYISVVTMEIGRDFCGGVNCGIDRSMFNRAMDRIAGPVGASCSVSQ
jgi:hypothetical protein